MAEIASPPLPASASKLRPRLRWLAALLLLTAGWLLLLVLTKRLDIDDSVLTGILTFTPPVLMTLLSWIVVRARQPPAAAEARVDSTQAVPEALIEHSTLRFRIGAFSVLTPFGNALETIQGTQAKKKLFQVDRTLRIPGSLPVHAAMVPRMPLERMGYPANTRDMAARITAMLAHVLDELHRQQDWIGAEIPAPGVVCLLAPPLLDEAALREAFAAAWSSSPWRDVKHELRFLPGEPGAGYALIDGLQRDINQFRAPFALLLAADSLIERDRVAQMIELDQVFSHTAPNGIVPSESAAGLLLLHPEHGPAQFSHDACRLGRSAFVARPGDGSSPGTGPALLPAAMAAAIAADAAVRASIGAIVSDADHRAAGMIEAAAAMTSHLPHLDPLADRISPMQYAGAFGAATDLVHICLGAEQALTQALSVGVLSASDRGAAALLVMPPAD